MAKITNAGKSVLVEIEQRLLTNTHQNSKMVGWFYPSKKGTCCSVSFKIYHATLSNRTCDIDESWESWSSQEGHHTDRTRNIQVVKLDVLDMVWPRQSNYQDKECCDHKQNKHYK